VSTLATLAEAIGATEAAIGVRSGPVLPQSSAGPALCRLQLSAAVDVRIETIPT
jgi:hypothetical protein